MNQINKQTELKVEVLVDADEGVRPVASPSRRRVIKLGAATVPVLATLTSPSALAGTCITTSAWGSDQVSQSASQAARHAIKAAEVTPGYTISAWNSSADGAGTPWSAFKTKYGITANPNSLTFRDIYTIVGNIYMRDLSSSFTSNKVVGGLADNVESYFLVAMLNYVVWPTKPPLACVTDDNWKQIVAGSYAPAGNLWGVVESGTYVKNNHIVTFT